MLKKVAVLALDEMAVVEFGILCEVFGIDRSDDGLPPFDFHVVAAEPGPVRLPHGLTLTVEEGLDAAADADLIAVPAPDVGTEVDPRVLEALRAAHARGAWVMSACTGAFVLAAAGLLDGRPSTTHWKHTAELADACPLTTVDPDVLYVERDRIITSAGTAASIDASLHLVRTELGPRAANVIARRMVVPPQRDGGQAQYIAVPVPECADDGYAAVIDWIEEHLAEDLTVDVLAARALQSPRTFARRFRESTGTTPAAWVARQRLARAQQLLESTDLPVEDVARRVGFGQAAVLRHHFSTVLHTSPQAYRRRFTLTA
ncbi:helix-turn-helix domain-containing protein [Amnibacterium setariae]|uniref:Helix-turn-helix domain-containing protein n=1 Tax=Amnibacterium setariae TaxID=2306585 RepID=A0A3A1U4I8_9MICO|nr:helix-turn-helix domain-containing protein [Amnibacterium setariae]RIX31230.1 helix-turn-helix domain-containing protein [Amnibacterium setariae]